MRDSLRQRFGLTAPAAVLLLPLSVLSSHADPEKALAPIPSKTVALMSAKGTSPSAPLVLRTYKKEAELEVWKRNKDGRFVYIKTFPICRWSGQLGPKHAPGDRQTPEGFYSVGPKQMNPNSHYYLSFDTGYPNAYDKAHGGSGSAVMVHGTCSSMGCFAMTDAAVGEIYAIARDALKGGQPAFQLQAYPFHMSAKNIALYRSDKNIAFWRQLKEGSDRFESTGELLDVGVANGDYTFGKSKDPAKEAVAEAFHTAQLARVGEMVKDGSAAVRTTYSDGGQNAIFAALLKKGANLGDVSRPEALAYAGIDVTLVPARKVRKPAVPPGRIDIVVAEWRPDAAPVPVTLVKANPAPFSASLVPVAFEGTAMTYALYRPPQVDALIAGAMPMRAASITN